MMEGRLEDLIEPEVVELMDAVDFELLGARIYLTISSVHSLDNS